MNYSLGNMLNGGESLNADGLSLDLQFATDKTLTARKGPTPTFTRASTATFVGSDGLIQSAAVNAARFDHDPVTLACKGLLIEESRTNLQRNSADLSLWVNGIGTTVTTNQTTAPDGTSTADTLTESASNQQHFVSDINASITSGVTYTLSIFAKKGAGLTAPDLIQITGSGGAFGTTQYATFNIQTGSVNSSAGGTATIQSYGNGWYRLLFTVTATATTTTAVIVSFVGAAPTLRLPSYLGLITSDVFLWGAQLEAGSFATSYIPTTTASVVRSADVCSITGAAFTGFYNQSEGTFLSQTTKTSTNTNAFVVSANNNSFNEDVDLRYSAVTQAQALVNVSNVNQITGFARTITSGSSVKQALAYKLNDFAYSVDVTAIFTDTTGSIPTVSQLNIGNTFNNSLALNGHIASIRYFKKRLANAKLQAITA
jgi:hypothetical protein